MAALVALPVHAPSFSRESDIYEIGERLAQFTADLAHRNVIQALDHLQDGRKAPSPRFSPSTPNLSSSDPEDSVSPVSSNESELSTPSRSPIRFSRQPQARKTTLPLEGAISVLNQREKNARWPIPARNPNTMSPNAITYRERAIMAMGDSLCLLSLEESAFFLAVRNLDIWLANHKQLPKHMNLISGVILGLSAKITDDHSLYAADFITHFRMTDKLEHFKFMETEIFVNDFDGCMNPVTCFDWAWIAINRLCFVESENEDDNTMYQRDEDFTQRIHVYTQLEPKQEAKIQKAQRILEEWQDIEPCKVINTLGTNLSQLIGQLDRDVWCRCKKCQMVSKVVKLLHLSALRPWFGLEPQKELAGYACSLALEKDPALVARLLETSVESFELVSWLTKYHEKTEYEKCTEGQYKPIYESWNKIAQIHKTL